MAYGIEVRSSNGGKVVLDPNFKPANLIVCKISGVEASSTSISPNGNRVITAVGVSPANTSDVFIAVEGPWTGVSPAFATTRGNDQFTITNKLNSTSTFYFFCGRYA